MVVPILVAMLFGIIEFGLTLRDHTVVTSNVRMAVRVASTGAEAGRGTCFTGPEEPPCAPESTPALAQEAADAIQRSGAAMPPDYIEYILVYKSNSQGYPGTEGTTTMPSSCTGITDCVRFTWRDSANQFRYAGGTWDARTINACFPGTPTAPQDRVGVYLQARHPFVTGVFGAGITLSEKAVMDFEPLPSDKCKSGEHG